MALVFYARVSSKGQNLDRQLARAKEVEADKVFTDKFSGKNTDRPGLKGQNLARQLARAKEVEADKVFTDKFSGKTTDRPGLHELLDYVREGDTVEVVSLDRLSRNYKDIQHLVQELKNKGVSLIVDDLPQTHTGNNLVDQFMLDMMINLMGFVAQNEREKIRERQRQGIEQAKKRGAYKGRPTKFSEDSNDREGRLVFEGIKKDYQTGNYKSKAGLARKYGLSRQQLYRIIKLVDDLPQTHTGNNLVDQFMLDMMINLMGFVAQNEREKIRERQRQGIEQAKKRGAYKGRPTKFSEDSNDREGRLVFEGIKKDYQTGNYKSKAGLARKYGLSRQQLYRIIKRIEQAD